MALHPARDALVVARRKIHAVPRRRLRHAFPARGVPDRRVRHARDLPALEPRMLRLNPPDLGKLPVRRPLDALVRHPRASVKLQNAVDHAVVIDRPPRTGKRLSIPEVIAPADRPPLVRRKRLDHVRPLPVLIVFRHVAEVLKKLPLIHVPRPIQPRLAQLRRQRFQLLQILRLLPHQRPVVRHQSLHKAVILRLLSRLEPAVDEQPFKISVPRPAGVQRVVRPLRQPVCPAHAGIDRVDPRLLQLPGLVEKHHVVFRALILPHIAVARAVAERDRRPVWKFEPLVRRLIFRDPRQLLPQRVDMVVLQLPQRPAHDQKLDPRIPQRQQLRLCAHSPALPAASGPAIGDVPVPVQ